MFFWDKKWTCTRLLSIDRRLMVVELENTVGAALRVLGAHFHHHPERKPGQWLSLKKCVALLPPMPTVTLADQNSIIIPGLDNMHAHDHDTEFPTIKRARREEVMALETMGLTDAWDVVYEGCQQEHLRYTYDFRDRDNEGHNPRRLD